MKFQVNKNHYGFTRYVNKARFMSYYYQLKLIYELNPESILEIGAGTNFLKKQLSDELNYKTLDIAEDLSPDIIGSVDKMPLKDKSFDLVCAFQVLEHLPFDKFEECLNELSRVSKRHVLISLPNLGMLIRINFKIPVIPELKFAFSIPQFFKKYKFNGEHYWEIGVKGYSLRRIKKIISKYFKIKKVFSPYENRYHVFFVLEKIK